MIKLRSRRETWKLWISREEEIHTPGLLRASVLSCPFLLSRKGDKECEKNMKMCHFSVFWVFSKAVNYRKTSVFQINYVSWITIYCFPMYMDQCNIIYFLFLLLFYFIYSLAKASHIPITSLLRFHSLFFHQLLLHASIHLYIHILLNITYCSK